MKKRLYVHIGTPKTGTCMIQKFLYNNKNILENINDGYCYPCAYNPDIAEDGFLGNLHEMFLTPYTNEYHSIKEQKEYWHNKLMPIINSSKAQNVIISCEALFHTKKQCYIFSSDVLQNFENVKIIVYLRKPAEYAASIYSQLLRLFPYRTIDLSQSIKPEITYKQIYSFIDMFSKENVIIRPYEKEQWVNNNLIDDFLSCIGINECVNFQRDERINESIDYDSCEAIKLKNEFKLPIFKSRDLSIELINAGKSRRKVISVLSDDEILEITNKYKGLFEDIAKIYGKEKFFLDIFPKEYKQPKNNPDEVLFTKNQLAILHNLIKEQINFYEEKLTKSEKEKEELEKKLKHSHFFAT